MTKTRRKPSKIFVKAKDTGIDVKLLQSKTCLCYNASNTKIV